MEKIRRKLNTAAVCLLLLCLCACAGAGESGPEPEPRTLTVTTPPPAARLTVAIRPGHPALMANDGSGDFFPERAVTKSDFCRLLAPLLEGLPECEPTFTDYRRGNSGYMAAASLFGAGLLPEKEDGPFGPDEPLTRGELSYVLRRLSESLPAGDSVRLKALAADVSAGATARSGRGGGGNEPILREELAVVLVRLAGRTPDEAGLFLAECLPGDITRADYAWAYIADAVTEGVVTAPEPGVHRAYNWLYAVWEDGTLVTNVDYGVWAFGPDGRYTTGNGELDGYLAAALDEIGSASLSDEEALKAAYLYVKYYGEYLVEPEDLKVTESGVMGWEYERAQRFFENHGGTCYGFAAAFGLLARALGQEAYIVSATVNQFNGAHAFVVIPEGGTDWIYDVELEATRQYRHADLDLFHIQNYTTYFYWYESIWSEP